MDGVNWGECTEDERKQLRKEMVRLMEKQLQPSFPDRHRRHVAARRLVDIAIRRENERL